MPNKKVNISIKGKVSLKTLLDILKQLDQEGVKTIETEAWETEIKLEYK